VPAVAGRKATVAKKKVLLSLDESDLEYIDDAAAAVGENRSQFLLRAAELRIEKPLAVTGRQLEAVRALLLAFGPGCPP
jgi:uncharacterized protein (DUF1778 family)